jgi:2-methylcitrate dehydratase
MAAYVAKEQTFSSDAYSTAKLCLQDTLACGFLALQDPHCRKHLGPIVPEVILTNGIHVPGTKFILDPIQAAYNMGVMNRWLDYNDTWLAAEWGHPSDNIAAILAVGQYVANHRHVTIKDVLNAMIKAYEIQGVLALKNSLNARGFDHVLFVKVASAAISAYLLGQDEAGIAATLSHAFIDTGPLRAYRHAPNTGPRKSWAAGDASSRGAFLAFVTSKGEPGYPSALTTPRWGFNDVILGGHPLVLDRPLDSYVMENILFKVRFPAEFHAQTAVEAALHLHPLVKDNIEAISRISIQTHQSALRIISKTGPLHNFADRDHCLQYMTAVPLLFGELKAEHYSDAFAAAHPEIDRLREKFVVEENAQYTQDYYDPDKRSIANAVTIHLDNGEVLGPIAVEYPLGHRRRRSEAAPFLRQKLAEGLKAINAQDLLTQFPLKDDMLLKDFIKLLIR